MVKSLFLMGMRGCTLVIKFLLTLYIARFIGLDVLGFYGLLIASSFLYMVSTELSLMYVISRRAVLQSREELCAHLKNYLRYLALVLLISCHTGYVIGLYEEDVSRFLIIALVLFCEMVNNQVYTLLLNLSRPVTANILHFVRSALWAMVFMVMAYLDDTLRTLDTLLIYWLIGSLVAMAGATLLFLNWPWRAHSAEAFAPWFKDHIILSKTALGISCMNTIMSYSAHFIMSALMSMEMVGIYIYFSQAFSAMMNLMQTGMLQMKRPEMITLANKHPEQLKGAMEKLGKQIMGISGLMALGAFPTLYYISLYTERAAVIEHYELFAGMLIIFMIAVQVERHNLLFYSVHKDNLIFKVGSYMFPITLCTQALFISQYELIGAVLAGTTNANLSLWLRHREKQRVFASLDDA